MLALDRFVDFATGSNSVAPVRETAAQCLCVMLCKLSSNSVLTNGIVKHLRDLLQIDDDKVGYLSDINTSLLNYLSVLLSDGSVDKRL